MHTDVILTNKRRTHAQSNYTNTKLKVSFGRLSHNPPRKRSGPIYKHITDNININEVGGAAEHFLPSCHFHLGNSPV